MRTLRRILFPLLAVVAVIALGAWAASSQPAESRQDAPKGRISPLEAAALGVIEGLSEYLPISSTGHLILASHYMDLTEFGEASGPLGRKLKKAPAIEAFEIVIQLGAIIAVLGLYRGRVRSMLRGLLGRSPVGLRLTGLLLVAFLPAAIVGLLFHKTIKEHLFGPVTVAAALVVGGAVMIVGERFFWRRRRHTPDRPHSLEKMYFRQAVVIGLAQCLAMWPGTSRSMVTIVAALVVGLDVVTAAEFSFLLALPTLGAATVYEGIRHYPALIEGAGIDGMLIGLIVSGIVAALAVKGFVKWLTHHGLMPFGFYRIALGAAVLWYFLG